MENKRIFVAPGDKLEVMRRGLKRIIENVMYDLSDRSIRNYRDIVPKIIGVLERRSRMSVAPIVNQRIEEVIHGGNSRRIAPGFAGGKQDSGHDRLAAKQFCLHFVYLAQHFRIGRERRHFSPIAQNDGQ